VRAPELQESLLEQALRPETDHGVYNRHCLPPKNPTGHRKANCRITEMHHSHNTPPTPAVSFTSKGRNFTNSIGTIAISWRKQQGTTVP
jgi:hypothetical protein